MNGGETSVALIVGGANAVKDGVAVIATEIFDFAMGKFLEGPPLKEGERERCWRLLFAVP